MATIAHLPNTDEVSQALPHAGADHARLRTKPAAVYAGLSPRTLEALRVKGGGPTFIRIGRAVIYDTRDLDAWLSARKRTSTSDQQVSGGGSAMNAIPGIFLGFGVQTNPQPAPPPLGPFGREALNLHGYGLAPLPVSANKKPQIKFAHLRRRHSAAGVARLVAKHANANVAVITDLSNPRLTVVDIDDPPLIQDMLDRFGDTPLQVDTPSGGRHLYYRYCNERQDNRLEDMGVDVKAGRQYVIVPPSIGRGAGYSFHSGSWSDLGQLPCVKPGSL